MLIGEQGVLGGGGQGVARAVEAVGVFLIPGIHGEGVVPPDGMQLVIEAFFGLIREVVVVALVVGDCFAGEDRAIGDAKNVPFPVGGEFVLGEEDPCAVVVIPEELGVSDESDEGGLGLAIQVLGFVGNAKAKFDRALDGGKFEGDEELRFRRARAISIDGIEQNLVCPFRGVQITEGHPGLLEPFAVIRLQSLKEGGPVGEDLIPSGLSPVLQGYRDPGRQT